MALNLDDDISIQHNQRPRIGLDLFIILLFLSER